MANPNVAGTGALISLFFRTITAPALVAGVLLSAAPSSYAYSGYSSTLNYLCKVRSSVAGREVGDSAEGLWEQSEAVLLDNCQGCHLEGGLASNAGARFQLRLPSDSTSGDFNYESVLDLARLEGGQYLLNKSVGAGHGGGVVLDAFGSDYKLLSQFAESISGPSCDAPIVKGDGGATGVGSDPIDIGASSVKELVQIIDKASILRRAALVVGRRLPTEQELNDLQQNKITLDAAIEKLMTGEGFHQFLLDGANDQLLMEAFNNGLFPVQIQPWLWPAIIRTDLKLADTVGAQTAEENNLYYDLWIAQNFGHSRAPLELIAYIVENDRSYKEVVTADYTMVTPLTGDLLNSGIEWSESLIYDGYYTEFHQSFQRGLNLGQPRWDQPFSGEMCSRGACAPENYTPFKRPHAGVLSTLAFQQRYPTTETNRNRARARWAFQFFLGVDIEASASRTTDPEALADLDNPTLNNPACTVCHEVLDPVAGAFQNYDEQGVYRVFEGMDSLPQAYKFPEDPNAERLYQDGDTWFRDMRLPGFDGETAPNAANSLQWLGQQIANDPRFASATVDFWWPAVMGAPVLRAPEDPSLPRYAEKLAAFNLQRKEIRQLAKVFVDSDYRLKPLLTAMVQSPWFSAGSDKATLNDTAKNVVKEMAISGRRLLTPEELKAKTDALTGLIIGADRDLLWLGTPTAQGRLHELRTLYGGIDSYGVIRRTRESTAVMAQVGELHAAALACWVENLDLSTRDGHRLLLDTVNFDATPTDNRATRLVAQKLYQTLHGRNYSLDSDEVSLVVDLLIEAAAITEYPGCPPEANWDLDRKKQTLIAQGVWQERFATNTSLGWRVVLNYLFGHFDYLYE